MGVSGIRRGTSGSNLTAGDTGLATGTVDGSAHAGFSAAGRGCDRGRGLRNGQRQADKTSDCEV